MFIIQSGRVRLLHATDGKTIAIAEMEKGDFFGEMSLLEGTARNVSAEAIDSLEIIEINSTTFDRMIRGNIEIAVRMLRKLSGRLQKAEGQIAARLSAPPSFAQTAIAGTVPCALPGDAPREAVLSVPRPAASPRASPVSPGAARTVAGTGPRPVPPVAVTVSSSRANPLATSPARVHSPRDSANQGPRLICEAADAVFPLPPEDATVGRYDPVTETQPEVDLTLVDIKRSVSRRHAKITAKEGSFYLTEEVGALNGTFINGSKLVTGKKSPLKNGDQINLGTVHLVFRS